jgi:2-methylcitrate dehydratase PrpD
VQEQEIKALIGKLTSSGTVGVATVIGAGLRTEPSKAALINGTAGVALELDEGNRYARGHPAIHALPPVLAVAEEQKCSGKDLLTAFVLGYEIGVRLGIACKLRPSMHPHGTWGTVGAAGAVGKLMGYGEQAMKEMINVSSSLSLATSWRTMLEGGTVRNVYSGISGFMAILAHDLVQTGFTGESDGLGSVFGNVVSDAFSPEVMIKDLGSRYEITRNYFKRYACIRANHATLDALSTIIDQIPESRLRPDDVSQVEVKTYSMATQFSDQNPLNEFAAKFSIPFSVATFIFHGHAGASSFRPEAVANPRIRALAQKVTVEEDRSFTAMMPDRRPSKVRITMSDGKELDAETYSNKGDSDDPYSPEELQEKYYELTAPIWGREVATELYSAVMELEKVDDVNQVTAIQAPLTKR